MAISTSKPEEIKIVISGLDNAGKTSFLIALRKKYNFYERVKNLKPTIKIDYSTFNFLNWNINFWDMGGQLKYREFYINNPIYFADTDYLYYFIDIQDELKFEESVKYLHELLNIYRNMEYSSEIIVCFSKYDPKFKKNELFSDRIEKIKKLILLQNKDLKFEFFDTSYYDISSLSKALSYSLNKLLNLETIDSEIKKIVKIFNCDRAILYNNAGIVISDYYRNIIDTREFEEHIYDKLNEDLEFFQRMSDENMDVDERLTVSKSIAEYVRKYEIKSQNGINTFYFRISMSSRELHEIKAELNAFKKYLETIIK